VLFNDSTGTPPMRESFAFNGKAFFKAIATEIAPESRLGDRSRGLVTTGAAENHR
jgi:hypothetical protein